MNKNNKNTQTLMVSKEEARADLNWFILDATGKTLGRFASEIAKILRGKHKPNFTFQTDCGDGVIVINAGACVVSGKKEARKSYHYHTGHIGGHRELNYRDMLRANPEYIIEHAVWGMLPKTKLAKVQMKKLRVFKNEKHGMEAQKPNQVNI